MFRFKSWENLTAEQQLSVIFLALVAVINVLIFAVFGSGQILYYSLISTTAVALLQER